MIESVRASLTHSRKLALMCALLLPVCAILIHPVVESGLMDEWSYARSAQTLAETGHVVYNGWATAMLGWQLVWGAGFFKLFGFSFLIARISGLILAMAIAFVTHRIFVRLGINDRLATFGTMTILLCPVMFPLSLSFMSDIPGMLALVLCSYACVRSVQARTENSQAVWLIVAAIGNAIGGTARQIAWVGVLVMVPCTMWLLRSRRRVIIAGSASWLTGVGIITATLLWFHRQPFSVTEPLRRGPGSFSDKLIHLPANFARPTLELALFLLPVTLLFLPVLWHSRLRALHATYVLAASSLAAIAMIGSDRAGLGLVAPFLRLHGNYLSPFGLFYRWPMHCHYPIILSRNVGACLSVATIIGLVAVGFSVFSPDQASSFVRDRSLLQRQSYILLGPMAAAYVVLLIPRLIVGITLDRYLLPLMPALVLLLLHVYQRKIGRHLPWAAWVFLAICGLYSVAISHDLFATYRAALIAVNELRAAGVARTNIDGGWEYNASTQLQAGGYIHQQGLLMPKHELLLPGTTQNACPIDDLYETPSVLPEYSLSMDATACEGQVPFAPVSYNRWLSLRPTTIYIVRNPVVAEMIHHNTGGEGGPGDLCWGTDAIDIRKRK